MSIPADPNSIRDRLAGACVRGAISLPNSGLGVVFDNGLVLDLRMNRILSHEESNEALLVARRALIRQRAELAALEVTGEIVKPAPCWRPEFDPADVAEKAGDHLADFDFELPFNVSDADESERDEARSRRRVIIDSSAEGME